MVCRLWVFDCCVLCWCYDFVFVILFFFFKQKTAYEMRISDWSSDVCSSDLPELIGFWTINEFAGILIPFAWGILSQHIFIGIGQIGRASCRERVCQYV